MKWYQVRQWGEPGITEVEVVKETSAFVTVLEKDYFRSQPDKLATRESKRAKAGEFFPTFAEARQHLLDKYKLKMDSYKSSYELAKKYWEETFLMEPTQ